MNETTVYIEDNIMQKDTPITAGSKILSGFKSPFNATVVEKLNKAGIKVEKSVAMDEFGLDDYFSDDEKTLAAVNEVVADKNVCVLCNDVFGKIRRQAALNGLCYIKPTYGTVSRYGLIPTVASMDQIGVLCANVEKGFEVLEMIREVEDNHPSKEGNELSNGLGDRHCECNEAIQTIRIGLPTNVWNKANTNIIAKLSESFTTNDITLDNFNTYHQLLYILSSAEFSNDTNRYDGIKFGYRNPDSKNLNDLYFNTRSEGFTLNTKLNIIMGASVLSQENYQSQYEKAMKIRRLIKESLKFDTYDVIALPIELKNQSKYEQSALYALTSLTGLPSITIPYGDNGVQFIVNTGREDVLETIATQMI